MSTPGLPTGIRITVPDEVGPSWDDVVPFWTVHGRGDKPNRSERAPETLTTRFCHFTHYSAHVSRGEFWMRQKSKGEG